MQLPLTQTSVAGSAGGVTPTEEATHSGVPAMEQVVAVRVHDLPVFTCLTQYSVRDNTLTRTPSIWPTSPQDTTACTLL